MNTTVKKILCRWFSENDDKTVTIGSIWSNTIWGVIVIAISFILLNGLVILFDLFKGAIGLSYHGLPDNPTPYEGIMGIGAMIDIIIFCIIIIYLLDKLSKVEVTKCDRDDKL